MLQILSIKKSVSNRTVTIIKNLNKKKDSTLAILIRILKKKTLSNFLSLMQLNTYRKIVVSKYRLEKNEKNKGFGFAVMSEHVTRNRVPRQYYHC